MVLLSFIRIFFFSYFFFFYCGFVYRMLDIPIELFTPIFAIARIAGWSAHRIEELVNAGKIIRPAYKYVGTHKTYLDMDERNW